MNETLQKIKEIKQRGYHLDLGDTINQTFENYKKIALLAGAVMLLLGFVFMILGLGIFAVLFDATAYDDSISNIQQLTHSTTGLLINFLSSVILAALLAPIYAGIVQIAHNAETNNDFDFGTAFSHYRSKYFKDLFGSALLIAVFSSGVVTLLNAANLYFDGDPGSVGVSLLGSLISIAAYLFTFQTVPLIILGNLNAVQAINASITVVQKRFWTILLLIIIFFIFAMLGVLAFCIGIFFTMPVLYALQYIIYRNALALQSENVLDEIGRPFN